MLNEKLREELISVLADDRLSGMFGDGMEREYVLHGCNIVGLCEMSDEDLVSEYEEYVDGDDEFLIQLKLEIESHKMIEK